MATKTFKARFKNLRDTAANWETNNPVILNGETIIVDTAAGEVRQKIGDGVKTYTQLPFTDETLVKKNQGTDNNGKILTVVDGSVVPSAIEIPSITTGTIPPDEVTGIALGEYYLYNPNGTEVVNSTIEGMTMVEIFAQVYPVGAVYMTANDDEPGVLFGGTWETFESGITSITAWKRTA